MFICWSFSTFSGNEWTPGMKDIAVFKATGCDTDQWARTAKEAGMGYILFLTKHHDCQGRRASRMSSCPRRQTICEIARKGTVLGILTPA